jgi:hypothetical protein
MCITASRSTSHLLFLILFASGCARSGSGIDFERANLSLNEYRLLVEGKSDSVILPRRASDISYGWRHGRDSYDTWWKIKGINANGARDIVSVLGQQLSAIGYNAIENSKVTVPKSIVPPSWPKSRDGWPNWWEEHISADVYAWEREEETTTIRSMGWLFAYDDTGDIAYIWNWDYQHSWLGWTDEQRWRANSNDHKMKH